MTAPIAIVPATEADAPAIHAIQRRAFEEEGRRSGTREIPPLAEPLEALVAHIRTQTVLTARDGERIVGSARGVLDGTTCTIRGVSVDLDCQGRGIGSALLRAVERAHPQASRFVLTTNVAMEGNVPFYERHGYRVHEITHHSPAITLAQMSKDIRRSGD